eukprot:1632069-Rhodomonas_salina.1
MGEERMYRNSIAARNHVSFSGVCSVLFGLLFYRVCLSFIYSGTGSVFVCAATVLGIFSDFPPVFPASRCVSGTFRVPARTAPGTVLLWGYACATEGCCCRAITHDHLLGGLDPVLPCPGAVPVGILDLYESLDAL